MNELKNFFKNLADNLHLELNDKELEKLIINWENIEKQLKLVENIEVDKVVMTNSLTNLNNEFFNNDEVKQNVDTTKIKNQSPNFENGLLKIRNYEE